MARCSDIGLGDVYSTASKIRDSEELRIVFFEAGL